MTTYDKASLVMIPSGYKDDKLYSIKPTDGSGDFTFSRDGSGASPATRVNASGLIEKGRTNELLQSNSFDTTWTTYNGTVTGGAADMNGGSNAWTLAKTGTYGDVGQVVSVTGVYTFSVYAKAGTLDHLQLSNSASPFMGVMFDLTNGTVASEANNIAAKVTDMGSGWYRCEAAVNQTASGEWRLQPADGVGGVPNANLGNVIIFQAQLESGLVATDYIETTTAPVSAGLLGDMPRLDYSGGATCPSLLLEPSRSNLITQSEYYGAWTASNANVTNNAGRSPEGVSNAAQIEFTSTSGEVLLQFANAASSLHIGSIFVKNIDVDELRLQVLGNAPDIDGRVNIDLANGTLSGAVGDFTPTIESYGDGWYRVAVGDSSNATTASPSFRLEALSSTGSFYVYGAQLEVGSYPTSYIPTYGSASTRGAEIGYTPTGVFGGSNTWTLVFEPTSFDLLGGNNGYVDVYDSSSKKITFRAFTGTDSIYISPYFFANSSYIFGNSGGAKTRCNGGRVVLRANGNGTYSLFTELDGVVQNDTQSATNISATQLYLEGSQGRGINQSLIFPTALTDAECIALTTI